MKKVIKSRIFIFVLTAIIFMSIGVYAANTYKASDVVYNASDGTSMNVNDALNELYKMKNNNIDINTYTSNFKIAASSGTGTKTSTITVPTGIKTGYLFVVSNAFYVPTLSLTGDGIKTQKLVGTWQASQGNMKANHIINIYYCEFNEEKTITATGTAGGDNHATSIAIITGLPSNLTIDSSTGVGTKNLSLAVPDDVKSGYVIGVANAFYVPTLYIEGDGIYTQTLLGTWSASQGNMKANHIVKVYYCVFNSSKNINAYMYSSGDNYAISTGILK